MPSSLLFAISNDGRVYALATNSTGWKELPNFTLEFKKVSAVPHFMWALGVDRQIYLHVHGLDVPIRIKEESYENERWFPIEGFSKNLLPTDRSHFSSMDGTVNRQIEKIHLPSIAWQWEDVWHLDCTLNGENLDHDGWSYAIDFPATYHSKKSWNSCVRRRKWVRFRQYSALNSWCAIAPLHEDPTHEPFSDIAVGGINIPGCIAGTLSVWAITLHGRVMFRTGVSTTQPEGLRWTAINTPPDYDVMQIAVGATGLVWGVLSNGSCIVRSGITRACLTGENWLEVKPPEQNLKVTQISIGTNSVWALTQNNRVWFRRGVHGEAAGISEHSAMGTGWVEMVGNISIVSVSSNDQVFGVGSEDHCLYFRTSVSQSDPTGKKWRLIHCPIQLSRTSSTISLSKESGSASPGSRSHSLCSLYKKKTLKEKSVLMENFEITSRSAPDGRHKVDLWKNLVESPSSSLNLNKQDKQIGRQPQTSTAPDKEMQENCKKYIENQLENLSVCSRVGSVGSTVGSEAHSETDLSVFDEDVIKDSGCFGEEYYDHCASQYSTGCDIVWTGCSAGAAFVDPQNLPTWFSDNISYNDKNELAKEWRLDILNRLIEHSNQNKNIDLKKYEKAIEISSWTKSGEARVQNTAGNFEECVIELEWVTTESGLNSGTFTVLDADSVTAKIQFSLIEITCVQNCSEPGSSRIAIHAPRLPSGSPVKLQFSGDNEMEDWLSHLSSVCCQINEVNGKPSDSSIWSSTNLGDVFVFDPTNIKSAQWDDKASRYSETTDVSASDAPYHYTLYNGMPLDTDLEITGCACDDADQIRFDLQCHSIVNINHKIEKFRIIAMHLNPRFDEKTIVLNHMEKSEWGNELRISNMVFAPGESFLMVIRSTIQGYSIYVNGKLFAVYKHHLDPESVTSLCVSGRVKLFHIIYRCSSTIIPIRDIFWRQMGGHLKKVINSGCSGIVWGIGFDNTAWYYTGGWGGQFLKTLDSHTTGKINPMVDYISVFVYENQRWNPVSGFSTTGLPTDRHMWSDVTGRHKRSKEHTKLPSMHWQWISDWLVDFQTPGGVDREGWQYAVDFPAKYHGKKQFTDYVRRRRWFRKCKLNTTGPWKELGNSKIIDVTICNENLENNDNFLTVWAISSNGACLFRNGVCSSNPGGNAWKHVTSELNFISISASGRTVWAVAKDGTAHFRYGISEDNPLGETWQSVDSPHGVHFKEISIGPLGVWAIDAEGKLAVRKELTKAFPEGTHWQILPNIQNNIPHTDGSVGFKSISVGKKEIWATSLNGVVCKRCGVTKSNPSGTGWNFGIPGQWNYISVSGYE